MLIVCVNYLPDVRNTRDTFQVLFFKMGNVVVRLVLNNGKEVDMVCANTEQSRELFEAFASDNGKWMKAIERDEYGNYRLLTTNAGWLWWQAATAALLSEQQTKGEHEITTAQKSEAIHLAANRAQEDAPVGFAWSGWACMYPGKLPRLYGALEIASVNLDAENGDQLIHLSTSPDPKVQADALDAARYRFLRDTCWSSDKELATVISLQMNKVWDEKIDEAMARNKEE